MALVSLLHGKVMLVDDDTFVNVRELARTLQLWNASTMLYLGALHKFEDDPERCHGQRRVIFAHGGTGIVLSGATMRALMAHAPSCASSYGNCVMSDVGLGLCLRILLDVLPRELDHHIHHRRRLLS